MRYIRLLNVQVVALLLAPRRGPGQRVDTANSHSVAVPSALLAVLAVALVGVLPAGAIRR